MSQTIDPTALAETLTRVRDRAPLVQCLTNAVVVNITANALLAVGAAPAMVDVPGEAGPFARVADAVLLNLGTPQAEQREAMPEAVHAARDAGRPWVLDPVAVGSLPIRTELAHDLLDLSPTVVRGNPSEILAVAGSGAGGRGVDTADDVDAAIPAARDLARRTGGVVAVSGPVDAVTDGERLIRVGGGHVLLTKVTGGGCALGALMAAFLAVADDPLTGAVAAIGTYAVAAEQAAEYATGPGSFAVGLLDALAAIDGGTLAAGLRLEQVGA